MIFFAFLNRKDPCRQDNLVLVYLSISTKSYRKCSKLPSDLRNVIFLLFFFPSAADWKLDEPAWSGRMKITAKGHMAFIKLEDKNTGK